MKKLIIIIATLLCIAVIFAGCTTVEKEITVISREATSGTRGAFDELVGITDNLISSVIIQSSTGSVMSGVVADKNSIGYISLGSLNDTVKSIKIDGVSCNVENIKEGSYPIARPFIIVSKKDEVLSPAQQDFKSFMLSKQGQTIVSSNGYIASVDNIELAPDYTAALVSGTIKISGSTSVAPLMNKIIQAYSLLNTEAVFEVSEGGSGVGKTNAKDGISDFGMSSRAIKSTEKVHVDEFNLALDGIAVIVNKSNTLENLTLAQLLAIYTGENTKFSEIQD